MGMKSNEFYVAITKKGFIKKDKNGTTILSQKKSEVPVTEDGIEIRKVRVVEIND